MYRREFLEAAGVSTAAVPLARGTETNAGPARETKTGDLSISIDDGALLLQGYPHDEDEGDVYLLTTQGDVHLGISTNNDSERAADAMLSFDPDTAEGVGDMLHEFAEKARNGEGWVYP